MRKKVILSLTLDKEIIKLLLDISKELGRSMSSIVNDILKLNLKGGNK